MRLRLLRLRPFAARLPVKCKDDLALPFAVLRTIHSRVEHCELNMGLDEIGKLLHYRFEFLSSFFQMARRSV